MPRLKIDDKFHFGGAECTITKISAFGATAHYGFLYVRIVPGGLDRLEQGWIPCDLIDNHIAQLEKVTRV